MRWRQVSEQRVWERPNRWRKKEKRIQEHQDNESKRAKEREKDRQRYFELPQYTHTHTHFLAFSWGKREGQQSHFIALPP